MAERDAHQAGPDADAARQATQARPAAAPRVFGGAKPASPAVAPKPPVRTGNPVSPRAPAVAPKPAAVVHGVAAHAVPVAPLIAPSTERSQREEEDEWTAAMSPVSSPEGDGPLAAEAIRDAVAAATDHAMAGVRTWQRAIEGRIDRIEGTLGELVALARAASAAPIAPRAPAPTVAAAPVAHHPAVQAFPAVQPQVVQPPVEVQASPIAAAPAPVYPVTQPPAALAPVQYVMNAATVPSYSNEPYDVDIGALDGSRRKRRIAFVAILLLVLGVGGLVTLAIVSQAAHGL